MIAGWVDAVGLGRAVKRAEGKSRINESEDLTGTHPVHRAGLQPSRSLGIAKPSPLCRTGMLPSPCKEKPCGYRG